MVYKAIKTSKKAMIIANVAILASENEFSEKYWLFPGIFRLMENIFVIARIAITPGIVKLFINVPKKNMAHIKNKVNPKTER